MYRKSTSPSAADGRDAATLAPDTIAAGTATARPLPHPVSREGFLLRAPLAQVVLLFR